MSVRCIYTSSLLSIIKFRGENGAAKWWVAWPVLQWDPLTALLSSSWHVESRETSSGLYIWFVGLTDSHIFTCLWKWKLRGFFPFNAGSYSATLVSQWQFHYSGKFTFPITAVILWTTHYQQDEAPLIYFLESYTPSKLTVHSEGGTELYRGVAYVCCEHGLNL